MYEDRQFEKIVLEGTIKTVSGIPDPEKNDYPDCLYTMLIEVDSFSLPDQSDHEIASEVIINVPTMKDNKIISKEKYSVGDKISCSCTEYDAIPQSIQEIQLADDIQSFEHSQYYVFSIKKVKEFSEKGNKIFSKRKIIINSFETLPKDEKAAKLRKERILNEISRVEEELKKHGGTFDSWKEEYKQIAEKYKERGEWKGWINDSFFMTGRFETVYGSSQSYIQSMLPYKEYLEDHNIDLIIIRMPSKSDFAMRVLAADSFQENPTWMEFYYDCLKNDIEIVDPLEEMWKKRFDFPLFYSPAGSIPRCLRRIRIENVFASGSFRAVNGRA